MSWLMKIPWVPKHEKKIHAVTYSGQILLIYFITVGAIIALFFIPPVERVTGVAGDKIAVIGIVHCLTSVLPQVIFKRLQASNFVLWEVFIDRFLTSALAFAASPNAHFMWIFFTLVCVLETFECGPSVYSAAMIFFAPFVAWHFAQILGWRGAEPDTIVVVITIILISVLWWFLFSNMTIQFRKAQREVESMHARAELEPMLREEKTRINAELHDVIGSELAMLALAESPAVSAGVQGDIRQRLQRMLERLRELIMLNNMNPDLPELLTDELAERAHEVARVAKLKLDCNIERVPLTMQQAFHLQRFFFEALANTMRHAQATELSVRLRRAGNGTTILIADNGRGFEVKTKTAGMGLQNLKERARRLNGRLRILSRSEKGTTVALRFS